MTEKASPDKETAPAGMAEHLHAIQTRLRAPKDEFNKHGGFSYRTAEGILAAAKACLPEGAHITMSDTVTMIGDRLFLKASVTLTIRGETISTEAWAMHPLEQKGMSASQISGAASSYARKYALCGLLAIDDSTDDPDQKKEPEPEKKEPVKRDAGKIRDSLKDLLNACKTADDFAQLTVGEKFNAAKDWLAENDQPKFLEIEALITKRKNALILDDSLPEGL